MHLFCPDFKAILVHLLGILARVTTMRQSIVGLLEDGGQGFFHLLLSLFK